MKPVISIIVPVYNAEKYLDQCVQSLMAQSLREIEIILIDDGSVDNSGEMCDEYSKNDNRVKVVHQNNQGQSVARNNGIEISTGDYVMFADSDDWVMQDFCRIPYEKAVQHEADCVMFKYAWVEKGKCEFQKDYESGGKTPEEAVMLVNEGVGLAPWNKLYRKTLFDNIRFPAGRVYEDIPTIPKLVHAAAKVFYENESLYYYRAMENSTTHKQSHKANKDMFEMSMERIRCYEAWGYKDMAYECMRWPCWTYLVREGRKGEHSAEALDYIRTLPGGSKNFSGSKKVMYHLLTKAPVLFDVMCMAMGRRT